MKYLLYCLIVLVVFGVFLPNGITGGLHNSYLLIILVALGVLILAIKCTKYICFCMSIKRELIRKGYAILKYSITPMFLKYGKSKHIIVKKGEKIINIIPVYVSKRYLTYYFDNIYKLELYKSTRLTIRPRVRQANIISGHIETRKISTKKLRWLDNTTENGTKMLIFNKYPSLVKDSLHSEGLSNGDKILDEVYLFDLKGFARTSLDI